MGWRTRLFSFFMNEEHTRPRITHYSSVPCYCWMWYVDHVWGCACSIESFGHASIMNWAIKHLQISPNKVASQLMGQRTRLCSFFMNKEHTWPSSAKHSWTRSSKSHCRCPGEGGNYFLLGNESNSMKGVGPGVATQTNNYKGLVQEFHKGIDYVHIIVHIM